MECYLTIRRNELLIQVKIWMITIIRKSSLYSIHSLFLSNYKQCIHYVLDSMLGSEKGQITKKWEYIMCDSIARNSRKCAGYSVESRLMAVWGRRAGHREGQITKGHEETLSMKDCSFFWLWGFTGIYMSKFMNSYTYMCNACHLYLNNTVFKRLI